MCVLFHEKADLNVTIVYCFSEKTLKLSSNVMLADSYLLNGSDCVVLDPNVVFQRHKTRSTDVAETDGMQVTKLETYCVDEVFAKVLTSHGVVFVRPQHVRRIDGSR